MEHTLNITWGQRVNICNLFQTIGTLHDMHISRVIRGVLVENESAQVLATNGIEKNEIGMWTIPTKNENRPSSITLDDEALKLFYQSDYYMARNAFSELLKTNSTDELVRWYLFESERLLNQGPGGELLRLHMD